MVLPSTHMYAPAVSALQHVQRRLHQHTHPKTVGCKVQLLKVLDGQYVIHRQPCKPTSCQRNDNRYSISATDGMIMFLHWAGWRPGWWPFNGMCSCCDRAHHVLVRNKWRHAATTTCSMHIGRTCCE